MLKNKILNASLFLFTMITFAQSVYVGKLNEISYTSLDSANNAIFFFLRITTKKLIWKLLKSTA
ncbi:MAG: hypothetical protein CVU01_04060 [Bacteroidetes bacterium HGW-Bacteroidetes-18]|nr:MAG: hypothetical protein CVU01_04060 [Bacteroidetes bacterium HGW-Bacteroidetes-18]